MQIANLGPLDHALPPQEGPVHDPHTFVRFLISALCIVIFTKLSQSAKDA